MILFLFERNLILKLKEEAFRAWLAQGSPEAAAGYRQARRAAAADQIINI